MANLFTRFFNPRYSETFRQSEGRMGKINDLVCEGWNFLSGREVPSDELPQLQWVTNRDGSVSFQWQGEKYLSCNYSINRTTVICSEFPNEDLNLDWGSDLGRGMTHLHMLATTIVDDVWPFVLTPEERDGLHQHIAALMNSYLRDAGLKKDILIDKNADEEDLARDDIDAIQAVVGGEEAYTELLSWASDRLPKREIEAFDEVVSKGNRESISVAVRGLMQQRLDATAVGQG